jgi:transposase-like protein
MTGRGLPQPLVRRNPCALSDGAKGLMAAIEEPLPQTVRQRCLTHKLRNLASKLPRDPELRDMDKISAFFRS